MASMSSWEERTISATPPAISSVLFPFPGFTFVTARTSNGLRPFWSPVWECAGEYRRGGPSSSTLGVLLRAEWSMLVRAESAAAMAGSPTASRTCPRGDYRRFDGQVQLFVINQDLLRSDSLGCKRCKKALIQYPILLVV
eukprot:450556-Prorocentrum_minimum.AAC.1